MVNNDVAIVLIARNGSERLPKKATKIINGKPVVAWIIERLRNITNNIVLATTQERSDDEIANLKLDVPIFRGSTDDVVERVDNAIKMYYPNAEFVMRALGDCPFIEWDIINRAIYVMRNTKSEAFVWHMAGDTWPVYGAREFPVSRAGWNKIVKFATEDQREHSDKFFHENRSKFSIVYHEPPASVYFRPYRLEIDWKEDFDFILAIGKSIGMDAPLRDVVRFLDRESDLIKINRSKVEKTGPMSSYDYSLRRSWMKAMMGKPVVLWDDTIFYPPDGKSTPIFCGSGRCLSGYGKNGVLFTKEGHIIEGKAFINCKCGSGRYWKNAI